MCWTWLNAPLLSGRARIESALRSPRRRQKRRAESTDAAISIAPTESSDNFEEQNRRELVAVACLSEMRFLDSRRAAIRTRRRMRRRRQRLQIVAISSSCASTSGPESYAEVLEEPGGHGGHGGRGHGGADDDAAGRPEC